MKKQEKSMEKIKTGLMIKKVECYNKFIIKKKRGEMMVEKGDQNMCQMKKLWMKRKGDCYETKER